MIHKNQSEPQIQGFPNSFRPTLGWGKFHPEGMQRFLTKDRYQEVFQGDQEISFASYYIANHILGILQEDTTNRSRKSRKDAEMHSQAMWLSTGCDHRWQWIQVHGTHRPFSWWAAAWDQRKCHLSHSSSRECSICRQIESSLFTGCRLIPNHC